MKSREDIIYELLLSLNQGNSGYINNRVQYAIEQYEELVSKGIIKEGKYE